MEEFENLQIKGLIKEIRSEISSIAYATPGYDMLRDLETVKDHIGRVQDMLDNIIAESEKDENE